MWGWISYDPELDLIFYGSGNPGRVEPRHRGPATIMWSTTTFARDPKTGEAIWAFADHPA